MEILYREMKRNDFISIKKLIIQAWFGEYKFSSKVKNSYADAYLRSYLADSNFRIVACDGNEVVGFLFGRYRNVSFFEKFFNLSILFFIQFRFLFTNTGRRKNRILSITNKTNRTLYKPYKKLLFNELALFIVDERYQNKGIGSALEKKFSQYLMEKGECYVYLFSDTYSNYEFYENKKYIKGGELEVDFKIKNEESDPLPIYFIYYKKLC